jgi:GT2 family glycosyltransferase
VTSVEAWAVSRLAVVAIGRNEGERLVRCLESVAPGGLPIVYVDSGSTDGSVEAARRRGASVVELDLSTPFTAARARNEGLARALSLVPDLELVQFVDGDCEVLPGWLDAGVRALAEQPGVAAVCGRVRERNREATIYNRLCDLEWDLPPGETLACGGNALYRVRAFQEVGGFDSRLIGGEEPELCVRLRRQGWKILRLGDDMVWHDAAMTRFGQWWRRSLRAGWSFAEGAAMHGASPERHWARENRSILFWGALVPLASLLLAVSSRGVSLLLLAGYPVLALRIYRSARRRGVAPRDARALAAFTVLGKFPQAIGQAQFKAMRLLGRRRRVVDWREAS